MAFNGKTIFLELFCVTIKFPGNPEFINQQLVFEGILFTSSAI